MRKLKVHFIHVGNMNNKGTQALFASDVSIIKEVDSYADVSVSTTDIEGINKMKLPLSKVLPPMVDLPYDRADQTIKTLGIGRNGVFYKLLTVSLMVLMPIQTVLSLFSVICCKFGLKPLYRGDVLEKVRSSDVVISHSDESFKETASSLPLNPVWAVTWWSMLFSRTLEIMVARSFHKPVLLFPNSVGPFRTWLGRSMAKLALDSCDYLLIRDPISYSIVKKMGLNSTKILTYDTALLFNQKANIPLDVSLPSDHVIGISAGVYSNSMSKAEVKNYITAHAKALDLAIEKHGFTIAFLPHYISGFSGDDLEISKKIIEQMHHKEKTKLIVTQSVSEFKALLNRMSMVISSKMHPAILAVSAFVPVVSIVYDHKQTGFFQRLDMTQCTLDISQVSTERLADKIENTWSHQAQITTSLAEQIPKWQRNVRYVMKKIVLRYFDVGVENELCTSNICTQPVDEESLLVAKAA
ncbi:MAG: polysaccharide pyruvyl transferase family protein [Candidatus Bathyarchaeia archaeon]|jgi:polysaccharide pyruvyl transferase WcaK-like protein